MCPIRQWNLLQYIQEWAVHVLTKDPHMKEVLFHVIHHNPQMACYVIDLVTIRTVGVSSIRCQPKKYTNNWIFEKNKNSETIIGPTRNTLFISIMGQRAALWISHLEIEKEIEILIETETEIERNSAEIKSSELGSNV